MKYLKRVWHTALAVTVIPATVAYGCVCDIWLHGDGDHLGWNPWESS